jgi:hypothetical protein
LPHTHLVEGAVEGDFGLDLGQGKAGVLETGDSLAEGLAFQQVRHSQVHDALGRGNRLGGDSQALPGQFVHHDDKALVELAEQGICRQAQVLEKQLGGVGGALADHLDLLAPVEAGEAGVHQAQGGPLGPPAGLGDGGNDDQVGVDSAGDEYAPGC